MRIGTSLTVVGVLVLLFGAGALGAQRPDAALDPPGRIANLSRKDVIWTDVSDASIRGMLEFAKVGARDYVVDLGSASGRPVIIAARDFGARSLGIEFEPSVVEALRKLAATAGVSAKAQFRRGDVFAAEFALDFASATVVTICLLPELFSRIQPQILEMKPGTRVVSTSAGFGDWQPDMEGRAGSTAIYLWTVPARVSGGWILQQPGMTIEIVWTQHYQKIRASARGAGAELAVVDETLEGDRIGFVIVRPDGSRRTYAGRISGRQMIGTLAASDTEPVKWSATRR